MRVLAVLLVAIWASVAWAEVSKPNDAPAATVHQQDGKPSVKAERELSTMSMVDWKRLVKSREFANSDQNKVDREHNDGPILTRYVAMWDPTGTWLYVSFTAPNGAVIGLVYDTLTGEWYEVIYNADDTVNRWELIPPEWAPIVPVWPIPGEDPLYYREFEIGILATVQSAVC